MPVEVVAASGGGAAGAETVEAIELALVLLHGRGATAESIRPLADALGGELEQAEAPVRIASVSAPQAPQGTWYPYSFLAPIEDNQPWLDQALVAAAAASEELSQRGIGQERQVVVGFSQGACLASEFVARTGGRWGGLLAFTGGLIGPQGHALTVPEGFDGTPVLFSSGDPDPHVPFTRVEESAELFRAAGADVTVDRYPGRPHTIAMAEVVKAGGVLARIR